MGACGDVGPHRQLYSIDEDDPILQYVKLSDNAFAPTKGSERAAGFDLYSAYHYEIPPQGKCLILTDISIALPVGCYGRIAPRS